MKGFKSLIFTIFSCAAEDREDERFEAFHLSYVSIYLSVIVPKLSSAPPEGETCPVDERPYDVLCPAYSRATCVSAMRGEVGMSLE